MANKGQSKELIKAQSGTYEVTKSLATGNFGSIYKAKRESDGKLFAIKCESLKMKFSLLRQASIVLASLPYPSPYFITIEERGTVPTRFLFIVTPLYGENLHDLMNNSCQSKRFSTASGLHLAEQTLSAIRDLHRNGFIHRDIKPSHFCVGREEDDLHHQIFLIDFGLCKRPRSRAKKGGAEEDFEEKLRKGTILYRGVLRYASLAAHQGKDLGYKDDMECWWYMVLEFFIGGLPWSMLTKSSEKDVSHMKANLTEQMISQIWKIDAEALSIFFEMLKVIRSPADIADYVDYDRIAESIKAMFEKTKSNKLEPPDWDCMTDYKGPAYLPVVMISAPEAGLKDTDFGEKNVSKEKIKDSTADKNKKKEKGKKKKRNGASVSLEVQ